MKKIFAISLTLALIAALMPGVAFAGQDETGNGCPSGAHYNLNIIGVPKDKTAAMDDNSGHRIFVPLGSKNITKSTKIYLFEGDFAVLDANGTDGRAEFQLPNPDPENDGFTEYTVFLRVLGKPGGKIKMATSATDVLGDEVVSDLQVIKVRETGKGKQRFENVCEELLYIYAWVWNPDTGQYEYMRLPLFSEPLQDYLWEVDNSGCKIAQLRFYEGVITEVRDPEVVPHLSSIDPASAAQGATVDVTITGANVDLSGVTASDVDFGKKININLVSAVSTEITVNISIDGNAQVGTRRVYVTITDGTMLSIPFEVTAAL